MAESRLMVMAVAVVTAIISITILEVMIWWKKFYCCVVHNGCISGNEYNTDTDTNNDNDNDVEGDDEDDNKSNDSCKDGNSGSDNENGAALML